VGHVVSEWLAVFDGQSVAHVPLEDGLRRQACGYFPEGEFHARLVPVDEYSGPTCAACVAVPVEARWMQDDRIGQYVTRNRESGPTTNPHLVESIIDDEPVTRCGRRLRKQARSTLVYLAVPVLRVCWQCEPATG
jgi:hypothetical protein